MDLKMLEETPSWEWPEDADKIFLKVIEDRQADSSDRVLAAELAGDFTVINDALADALLAILQNDDEPEALRGTAATCLVPALEEAEISGFDDPTDVPISEDMFRKIQESFSRLYRDSALPKFVRRRILEGSIRSPLDWHQDAIREAYSSDDEEWRLTAVFAMRWVSGFEDQILESLESKNENIHYQAVCAAGNWELDAAWSHVARLVGDQATDKPTLLAAIEAVTNIRPHDAGMFLVDLTDSDDDDIVEAAHEAINMADVMSGNTWDDDFDDDDDGGYVH